MNRNPEPSFVQSQGSTLSLWAVGVVAAAIPVGIITISLQQPQPSVSLELRVAAGAVISFVCLLVAALGLQRFANQHVADSWFVSLGALGLGAFSLAGILLLLKRPALVLPGTTFQDSPLSVPAGLFVATYLILAAANSRHLVSDRRIGKWLGFGSLACLVYWLAVAILGIFLLPFFDLRGVLPFPSVAALAAVASLVALAALILFLGDALRGGTEAHVGLIFACATLLGGTLAASLSLVLPAADRSEWMSISFLATSSFLLLALVADQARFIRIETGLRRQVSQTNDALAKSERAYRTLVENLGEGISTLDADGRIAYANPHLARLLGTTSEALRGSYLSDWVGEDQLPILRSELRRLAANEPRQFEIDLLTAQQKRTGVIANAAPVVSRSGRFLGAQLLLGDITERRRAERRLAELVDEKAQHLRVYEHCIENVTEGIFVLDPEHRLTYANRAFEEMTGYMRSEVENQRVEEWLGLEPRSEDGDLWRRLESGRRWRGELVNCRKDGVEFIAEVSLVPLREGESPPSGYLGVVRDITQQKRLEVTLTESADRLRRKSEEIESAKNYYEALIAGMTDILVVVDAKGRCTFVNEYGRKRLGYSMAEIATTKLPPFFSDLKRLENEYGDSIKVEVKDYEYPLTTRDGEVIHCSWYARPLFDLRGERIGAMAVARDITDFKRLQNQLKEHARDLEQKVQERTAELEHRVEQLAKILEIGEEIRLNVGLETILSRICEAIRFLGWRRVLIALRTPDCGTSRVVAAAGLSSEELGRVRSWGEIPFEYTSRYFQERFRISNSYFVDQSHELIGKSDPYTLYTDLGKRPEPEWQSLDALIVPIHSRGTVLGIITVDDPEDQQKPTVEKVRDLEIFADKAALAIENAEFIRQRQENEERARLLADITRLFHAGAETMALLRTVVEKSIAVLGDFCGILLVDEERRLLRPAAVVHKDPKLTGVVQEIFENFPEQITEGIGGRVASTSEPLFLQRVNREVLQTQVVPGHERWLEELDVGSLMVVPLRLGSVALGVMYHSNSREERGFNPNDLTFAQDLADRLALALENARLFQETEMKAHELEKASQLKSEFLARVSHELRTPLHAILTLSDILLRAKSGPLGAEQRRQVEIIQRSGRDLLSMINDILDLSKIEAGRMQPVLDSADIRALVSRTVEPLRALAEEKGLDLRVTFDQKLPGRIVTDPDRLEQALRNLVGNAVKFTRRGRITVHSARSGEDSVSIAVRDTGIGIPSERLDAIFTEFQQIDSSDAREFGGTGLGLAITRRLADLLGGEIKVESKEARGSCFTLIIPLSLQQPSGAGPVPAIDSEDGESGSMPPRRKGKPRLLVVDDDSDAQYAMQVLLEEEGFEVAYARSGSEALTLARKLRPDAILLDMMMPGMDGYKTTVALRSDATTREVPIIATTAKAMRGDREQILKAGCDDYLAKPFDASQLISCVQKWIAQPTEGVSGV